MCVAEMCGVIGGASSGSSKSRFGCVRFCHHPGDTIATTCTIHPNNCLGLKQEVVKI